MARHMVAAEAKAGIFLCAHVGGGRGAEWREEMVLTENGWRGQRWHARLWPVWQRSCVTMKRHSNAGGQSMAAAAECMAMATAR